MRGSAAVVGVAFASGLGRALVPELAGGTTPDCKADNCGCCCGHNCVTTDCYRRYVCNCSSGVYLRYCPGGTVRQNSGGEDVKVPYQSTFDVQIQPEQSGGYYFGFSVNKQDRGWVLASCLSTKSCDLVPALAASATGIEDTITTPDPTPVYGDEALTLPEWLDFSLSNTSAASAPTYDGPAAQDAKNKYPPGRYRAIRDAYVRYCPISQAFGWIREDDHFDLVETNPAQTYARGTVYGCLNRDGWVQTNAIRSCSDC